MIAAAILAVTLATHHAPTVQGLPLCAVASAHHKGTPPRQLCAIPLPAGTPRWLALDAPDLFAPAWLPASWDVLGSVTNRAGTPVALLVRAGVHH